MLDVEVAEVLSSLSSYLVLLVSSFSGNGTLTYCVAFVRVVTVVLASFWLYPEQLSERGFQPSNCMQSKRHFLRVLLPCGSHVVRLCS